MPLLSCPDCGANVSSAAVACAHCGHPFSSARPGARLIRWGTLLAILGAVMVAVQPGALAGFLVLAGFGLFIVGRLR